MQKNWEEEKEEMQDEMANLSDTLEMITLDKELAEEKAESIVILLISMFPCFIVHDQFFFLFSGLEKELEQLKLKFKLKGPKHEDNSEEEEDESEEDEEEMDDSKAVAKAQIQRLTEALMKLKGTYNSRTQNRIASLLILNSNSYFLFVLDLSVMEKRESEKTIKALEREKSVIPVLEDKIARLKEDLKKANEKIEELKSELDVALEAEDMIEELSEKKMELEEVNIRKSFIFFLIMSN